MEKIVLNYQGIIVYKYAQDLHDLLVENNKNHMDLSYAVGGHHLHLDVPTDERVEIPEEYYSKFLFTNIIRKNTQWICSYKGKPDLSFHRPYRN